MIVIAQMSHVGESEKYMEYTTKSDQLLYNTKLIFLSHLIRLRVKRSDEAGRYIDGLVKGLFWASSETILMIRIIF